jgi:putative ABC transport system permease protein
MNLLRILREWILRLLGVLRLRRRDTEIEEELRLHLELEAEEAVSHGASNEEARRLARIKLGQETQAMEWLRDQRGLPWLEDLFRDLRHGVRALRRAPGFAAVVILTLALAGGANTAIFSIVHGVLLRPLDYPRPGQLMYLTTQFPRLGFPEFPVSVPEYLEFRQFNHSFREVGAFRTGESNLIAGDRAQRIRSATVDAHLLNTLGVEPAQGRLFTADESGLRNAPPVAVISYELWQSAFSARPIVGTSAEVDGKRVQIVGVMARGADLMDSRPEVWLPLGFADDEHRARNNHNLYLIGRLKAGSAPASAQAELNALNETWAARAGITPGSGDAGHVFIPPTKAQGGHILQMKPLADQILGRVSRSIWVLQAAVGFVLLIACANVASLLLARAETRHRELAVLAALGASQGRLLRKALTESVILAAAGGSLGVLLARVILDALVRTFPTSLPRIGAVAVDSTVMLASLAGAVVCGMLLGLASMINPFSTAESLVSGSRGSTGRLRRQVRRGLVIAETALAVIVVVGAGLLLETVRNLNAVDTGFDRTRLISFSITLPPTTSDLLGRVRKYQSILAQLRDMPGVPSATGMTDLPLEHPLSSYQTEIAKYTLPSGSPNPAVNYYQRVMSGYFETMGIPILQGRGFQSTDAASREMVAVVNETLANTYWKGQNPIGRRLRPFSPDKGSPWFTVVGVAKDVKQGGVDQPPGTQVYLLVDQLVTDSPTTWVAISPTTMHMMVRTTLPATTLAAEIAQVVHEVDPSIPVAHLREMKEVFRESIRRPRLLALLVTSFSALALLLGAVGLYGVLAYSVAKRRREIGIRMALGAGGPRILTDVIREGIQLTVVGILAGTGSAVLLNRLIASLLFGVGPMDATTFAMAIPTIALVAGVACFLPAWRASRLDPNVVLRSE